MSRKTIVLSGINFSEGGPLTIYKECLRCVEEYLLKDYEIIALVHNKELFSEFDSRIRFIEFKDSKKSYLKRIYYEYIYFKKLSKKFKPYLWFSLHDMTPNVTADKRVVYCHNPMMFYNMTKEERKKPDILKANRKIRIAKGSGTDVSDVNKLLKQFEQMKSMMKMLSSGKMPNMGTIGKGGKFPF